MIKNQSRQNMMDEVLLNGEENKMKSSRVQLELGWFDSYYSSTSRKYKKIEMLYIFMGKNCISVVYIKRVL